MLNIKKEKVLDKRAAKGNRDDSAAGPIYKAIRPVKLDFSATNFKAKVVGWRLSIEKKTDTLFPAVCDCARGIAGIAAATAAQSEYHDPQILARANLASEDEEDSSAEHEKDNTGTQATNIHENTGTDGSIHEDHHDEHHDNGGDADDHHDSNGVDDGNNSVVDEEHNSGGHDNEGNQGIGSEEDDENGKASLGDGMNDGDVSVPEGNSDDDRASDDEGSGSELTDID